MEGAADVIEISRMVVVAPAPVPVLSRALAGAGAPGREGLPGMGSGAGSLGRKRLGADPAASRPSSLGNMGRDLVVPASAVMAFLLEPPRLIPNELAIALSEPFTEAVNKS